MTFSLSAKFVSAENVRLSRGRGERGGGRLLEKRSFPPAEYFATAAVSKGAVLYCSTVGCRSYFGIYFFLSLHIADY